MAGFIPPLEPLHQVLRRDVQLEGRDVLQGDPHPAVLHGRVQIHPGTGLGILEHVGEEILHDPPQQAAVRQGVDLLLRGGLSELEAGFRDAVGQLPQPLGKQLRHVQPLQDIGQVAAGGLGRFEEILGEAPEPLGFLVQHLHVVGRVLGADPLPLQQVHIGDDGGQGGFQVMGDVGHQLGLEPFRPHLVLQGDLQALGQGVDVLRQGVQQGLSGGGHPEPHLPAPDPGGVFDHPLYGGSLPQHIEQRGAVDGQEHRPAQQETRQAEAGGQQPRQQQRQEQGSGKGSEGRCRPEGQGTSRQRLAQAAGQLHEGPDQPAEHRRHQGVPQQLPPFDPLHHGNAGEYAQKGGRRHHRGGQKGEQLIVGLVQLPVEGQQRQHGPDQQGHGHRKAHIQIEAVRPEQVDLLGTAAPAGGIGQVEHRRQEQQPSGHGLVDAQVPQHPVMLELGGGQPPAVAARIPQGVFRIGQHQGPMGHDEHPGHRRHRRQPLEPKGVSNTSPLCIQCPTPPLHIWVPAD